MKKYKFFIFKVGLQVNLQLSQLKRPKKKKTLLKSIKNLYGQKDHLPWNTGQAKKSLKKALTGINKVPIVG